MRSVILLEMLTDWCRFGQPLVEFDPKAEARLRRKLDLFLVPTVSLLYLFCFIDRANIGKWRRTQVNKCLFVPDCVV
jgi:hypothetical protein